MSSVFSFAKITQNTGDNLRVPGWIGLALVFGRLFNVAVDNFFHAKS